MKNTFFSSFLILTSFQIYSQVPSDCTAPAILLTEYDMDIKDLALTRIFSLENADTAEIIIPTSYQDTIRDGLAAIFNLYSDFERDSVFDIYCVHNTSPSPVYTSLFNEIIVNVDDSYGWTTAWAGLNEVTGYTALDNLVADFGFTVTYYSGLMDYAILQTNQVINVKAFRDSIETFDGVNYTETNFTAGDANRITFDRTGDNMYYDFTVAWGDCPSGCTNRYTWQFLVHYSDCSVEFLGVDFFNGAPSEPMPAPVNCAISGDLSVSRNETHSWKIYPVPAGNEVLIQLESAGIVEITDLNGRIVYSGLVEGGNNKIDISDYTSGQYIVKLKTSTDVFVSKIVKQ